MRQFPVDPRLPSVGEGPAYLRQLNTRLYELFQIIAQTLNPTINYGWKDLTASVSSSRVPPASAPTLDAFGPSGARLEYRFAVGEYVFIKPFHVNHDIRPGGSAYLHVHWAANGTNVQPVKWELEVMRALGHGQAAFGAPIYKTVTQTPGGDAWDHMIAEVEDADALTLLEPDELIIVTLRRLTNGGVENTDQIFGLEVDLHYESDRSFTPHKAPDFYA
jgi:hypothetical protein